MESRVCPACGADNRAGAKFCVHCGAALALACPACGAPYAQGDRFCGECGARLETPGAAAADAPAAERRLVSVVFADLVGFTPFSESRDPEEVRELLSAYFDTARTLIGRYGGTVEKFIGDAVMAVWGTPVATEDDAERAVRAALELVAAVAALGEEVGAPGLAARAGVLTGEAAVSLGAVGEGMVAGDLVNTSARIQAAAGPGQVLVGESTRRAAEQAIVYADAGVHELKGKAEPVRLHRAVRVTSARKGALRSAGLEPPFVGRDRELRLVKDLFHGGAAESRAHLVSVTGIAGIGKSRLAWEFYKYFDGLAETVLWHRGRCPAYGEGVTYWALAEMIRMRAGIAEDEAAADAREKLRACLAQHVPDPDERAFVEPRLAHLLGLAEHAAHDKQDLFAAWRLFFERLAGESPVVLVFEDVQWADGSLLDFVEYLLDWSRSTRLFVLTLARPELAERRPTWGAGKRNFTSLFLEPLSPEAMAELLDGFVPGLPDDLRGEILARAEGVPLYAVETVRMLLDRGLLAQEGDVYRVTGEVGELAVPETLHGLIAARLDGLPPEERRLLQDASALGKSFTRAALAAVAGTDEAVLEPLLVSLARKEVLSLQADPRSPEHGQYGFLQDLVRHVAYETLSRRERRARHLAAAAYLERGDEDELAEVIAAHYVEADAAMPDAGDADAVRAKAHDWLVRAGKRAESLGAPSEAQRYLERAAELAPDAHTRARLLEDAGWMSHETGDLPTAERQLAAALPLFLESGDTHAWARASARLAQAERWQGRFDDAYGRLERAWEAVAGDDPDEDVAFIANALAGAMTFAGRGEEAEAYAARSLQIAEALGDPERLCDALTARTLLARQAGRPEEAVALLRRALELTREHGISREESRLLFLLSDWNFHRDRYEDALACLHEALEVARRRGARVGEWATLSETTYPLCMLGRWDEALAAAAEIPDERVTEGVMLSLLGSIVEIRVHRGEREEARRVVSLYDALADVPDVQDRSCYLTAAAVVARSEGRLEDALARGVEGAELGRIAFGPAFQPVKQGLVEAIEAALALGLLERAEELVEEIESVPPGLRSPYLEAQAHRFRARLGEEPEERYAAAAARFRELGIPFWLAVTLLEQGTEAGLEEAREVFARLGATPWLERAAGAAAERVAS